MRKPYPDALTQLRVFQRNQIPSMHAASGRVRPFTIGSGNPQIKFPVMAMAVLSVLLEHSRPTGRWMVVPDADHDVAWLSSLVKGSIGTRFPLFCIEGWQTRSMMLVLSDASCVLVQSCAQGWRIYPAVLYLRRREPFWTARVMTGKGKTAAPLLRLTDIVGGTSRPEWRKQQTHVLFAEQELIGDTGRVSTVETASEDWLRWAKILRQDIDAFDGIFAQFEGLALWPYPGIVVDGEDVCDIPIDQEGKTDRAWQEVLRSEGRRSTSSGVLVDSRYGEDGVVRVSPDVSSLRRSVWPHALPFCALTVTQGKKRALVLEKVARWVHAMQTFGDDTPRDVLCRFNLYEEEWGLQVLCLERGTVLRREGYGQQGLSKVLSLSPSLDKLSQMVPPSLAQEIIEVMEFPDDLRYCYDEHGVWHRPWRDAIAHVKGGLTSHDALAVFGELGAPFEEALRFWERQFLRM